MQLTGVSLFGLVSAFCLNLPIQTLVLFFVGVIVSDHTAHAKHYAILENLIQHFEMIF
jgi:hypothetical protein